MDDRTRRGLLTSTAVLLGATAGCQLFGGDGGEGGTAADRGADAADRDPEELAAATGDIHVGRTVRELPDRADPVAFGVTADGLYRFGGDDGWRQVRHGTPANPVPALTAADAAVGVSPAARPLISNGGRTLHVAPGRGSDDAAGTREEPLATLQEAVRRVPVYLRDQYTIDLATAADTPVTYDEDVLVPTVIGTGQAGQERGAPSAGPVKNLRIRGSSDDRRAVTLGSLMLGNVVGTSATHVSFVTLGRDSPYDDEGFGLSAYGSGEVHCYRIGFTGGPTNGLMAYGAKMKTSIVELGGRNLTTGLRCKRHGSVIARDVTGETTGATYHASANSTLTVKEGNEATGSPTYRTRVGGLIYDGESETWVGLEGPTDTADLARRRPSAPPASARRDHPEDPDRGAVWYVDGEGDLDEGFYGQTGDGPTRLG
jgi:hypothetical protein